MTTKNEIYHKGLDLFGQEQYQEAIAEYKKALEIDPEDGELYMALSISYYRLDDLDSSLENARFSAEKSPDEPLVYTNLSRILQKKGLHHEAEEAMAIARHLSMRTV